MKHCPAPTCPHRDRTGDAAEYGDAVDRCADCGAELVDGAAPAGRAPTLPRLAGAAWPLLVTALAIAAQAAATRLALFPVDRAALPPSVRDLPWASPLALGLAPLCAGALAVELAARLLPAWRRRRTEPGAAATTRAWRERAAVLAAAAASAVLAALWCSRGALPGTPLAWAAASVGWTAGATFLVLLVRLVDHHGLGAGFSVLLVGAGLPQLARWLERGSWSLEAGVGPTTAESLVAAVVVSTALATLGVVRAHERPRLGETAAIRLPVTTLVPFDLVAVVFVVPAALGTLAIPAAPWPRLPLPLHAPGQLGVHLLAVAGLGLLLARWFARPEAHLPAGERRAALVRSLLYLAALCVGGHLVARLDRAGAAPTVYAVATWTAILLDLWREWRARRAQPLVALMALAPVDLADADRQLAALREAGIATTARGAHHRALLGAFGPFVPPVLLVPATLAERARAVLGAAARPAANDSRIHAARPLT